MLKIISPNSGWVEVIVGPMFSGKSDELIRRLHLASIGKKRVICFKPAIDNRFSDNKVVSRTGAEVESISVPSGSVWSNDSVLFNIKWEDYDVVGFDEIQFFDNSVVLLIEYLAGKGKRVIASGLDTDFNDVPFEVSSTLMAKSDFVDKLSAVCFLCGESASKTYRLSYSKERIVVGDNIYEARCRRCFYDGRPCLKDVPIVA
jgi:thymidine kinase